MSFERNGQLLGGRNRPNPPLGWRTVPATTLHHMIDWAVLRSFWNRLVAERRRPELERYVLIAGFAGNAHYIVGQVLDATIDNIRNADRMTYDSLAEALCWQRYNLFEGPPWQFRPDHTPDPTVILQHFADLGANSFDFPIVVPPHGYRANTLYRAFLQMAAFNDTGAHGALLQCLELLEAVAQLDVIPACDVNWFALLRARFLALTPLQRQRFFHACYVHGWRPTDEQIEAAHAAATAP